MIGISLVSFSGRGATTFKSSFNTSDKSTKPGDDTVVELGSCGEELGEDSGCDVDVSLTSSNLEVGIDFKSALISFKTLERSIKPGENLVVVELEIVVVASPRESD